ncbi:MAG: 4-hydroxybenzoate decarboxylase [Deltaproteobacteria bacterium]|jgi:2,5-furandicarboxylate decarboxylase 1|nr:4-hydroxybenzoate decarboxylase [Deltaproteobacteria bacterium]
MDSLRDYLAFVKKRDLLLEVEEQVTREDVPELIERLSDTRKVLLFKRVKGYSCSLAANLVPSHEVFRHLFDTDNPYQYFLAGIKKTAKKVLVKRTLETVSLKGKDLLDFLPILKHYEKDSAPFITTSLAAARDPITGIVGRGIHRMEYRGKNRMGMAIINPPLVDIYKKHKAKGERMPITVTIGVDPILFLSMALKAQPGTDKLELAGGLKGKGIKVAQSLDAPIDVPAGAEIYLEGYIDTADVRRDGPLGEISGYYMVNKESPTMVVNRLSYQASPIYHALLPTSLEGDTYLTFVSQALIEETVKKQFPFIKEITFVQKTFGSCVIVSIHPADRSKIRNLILAMLASPMIKKVVVVDEDVDPADLRQIEWSISTRCLADKDIVIVEGLQGQAIDPQAEHGLGVAKMGIDATTQGKAFEEKARVASGNHRNIERILKSLGGAVCAELL